MSKASMSNPSPALTGYQFEEAQPDFSDLLWESYEVLACLGALVQHSNDSNHVLKMSDDARRGLGRLLRHCEKITLDAIGLAPERHLPCACQKKEGQS